MNAATRIIGIDPGLRRCGWGVIETLGNRLTFVAAGTVTPPVDGSLAERLAMLFAGLGEVLDRFAPGGTPCPLSVSIGGATYVQRAPFGDLYRLADQHLYEAKNTGRDRVAIMQAA